MTGFVYAVGDQTGRVKIGWSGDPLRRLKKTRDDLAAAVGVSGVTITRWESGTRKIPDERLPTVARKTGIPAASLRPDLAKLMRAEAAE